LHLGPWVLNYALANYNHALAGGGELVGGEARPGKINMRYRCAIRLTGVRLAAAVWPETAPTTGGGEATAALPPRLGFWREEGKCKQKNGNGSFYRS
jgi:hypothetical protein